MLPPAVREPISLAYLLARFTDTEADGAASDAERELLSRREELERWLTASPDRDEIAAVWRTIQEGQAFDQARFGGADGPIPPNSRARGGNGQPPPLSSEELDRYTYLVAGCVGAFWTRICARRMPGFARLPESEMAALGIHFGKGLQLVNILRDRQADRELGRVYVPGDRFTQTLALARNHLDDGARYAAAVKSRRLRAACALPLLLARETLDLVELNPTAARVKVPRSRVWIVLTKALFFPLGDRAVMGNRRPGFQPPA